MHRTHRVLIWLAGGLVAYGLAAGPRAATAQPEPMPPPAVPPAADAARNGMRGNALVVAINGTKRLGMTPRRPIRTVLNEKETVARVQPLQDDPKEVLVVGLQAGSTKVTMTDNQGQT